MEYRSPLGFNFKLEKSLSAVREEESKSTPSKDDSANFETSTSRKFYDSDKKCSGGNKNFSPAWQRPSASWKSPNVKNFQDESIEQYYHPSMLENPWEELESKGS